jgi:YVTN family beta-propeller protein
MQAQIDKFLSKKPNTKSIIVAVTLVILLCLCCLCLFLFLVRQRPPTVTPTPTPTQTETPTPTSTSTLTPTPTNTLTPTITLTPTAPTPTPTITQTPTVTFTSTITSTPNPLSGPQFIAVYQKTGNIWVTSRGNSQLVELDGNDLHVVSTMIMDSPSGIAIWQARGLAYVTNQDYNTVTEIDLNNRQVTRRIAVGTQPRGVGVDQESGDVFVANYGSDNVSCIPAGASQAATAYSDQQYLKGPVAVIGFQFDGPVGMVVDSNGTVAFLRVFGTGTDPVGKYGCNLFSVTTIGNDQLRDVIVSTDNNQSVYVSDESGRQVVLISNTTSRTSATSPQAAAFSLKYAPRAEAMIGKCVGVMTAENNRLVLLDPGLGSQIRDIKVGKQGKDGGEGLVYNPNVDVAYVVNRADNSVSRIANPCK